MPSKSYKCVYTLPPESPKPLNARETFCTGRGAAFAPEVVSCFEASLGGFSTVSAYLHTRWVLGLGNCLCLGFGHCFDSETVRSPLKPHET